MKAPFRLKDKVTELYYTPSREIKVKSPFGKFAGHSVYIKSNLSKKGKIYFTDPRKHISDFLDHSSLEEHWAYPFVKAALRDASSLEVEYLQIDN